MNYRPLGDRLIVRLLGKPKVTVAGMELTIARVGKKEWEDEVVWAEVVARGQDVKEVEIGEVVIMAGHAGKWVDYDIHAGDERTHRVIDFMDALAVDEERTQELKKSQEVTTHA